MNHSCECEVTCTGSREEPFRQDWFIKSIALETGTLEEDESRWCVIAYTQDDHEIWTYVRRDTGPHVAIYRKADQTLVAHYHGPAAVKAHQESCRLFLRAVAEGWVNSPPEKREST